MSTKTILLQIPNILTVGRVLLTIIMVLYYYFGRHYIYEVLWSIFAIASISDFFDGYLSRKFKAVSNFGKCLDPISDKLLLITSIILLVNSNSINILIAFTLMGREIIISGLREFLASQNVSMPVSNLAKYKTAFQLLGVGMCFFIKGDLFVNFYLTHLAQYIVLYPLTFIFYNLYETTLVVLLIATYTTLHTGLLYIIHSIKYLK